MQQSIDDCTKAIELDPNYVKAFLRRGNSYIANEMYEEAVRDFEAAFKMEKTQGMITLR